MRSSLDEQDRAQRKWPPESLSGMPWQCFWLVKLHRELQRLSVNSIPPLLRKTITSEDRTYICDVSQCYKYTVRVYCIHVAFNRLSHKNKHLLKRILENNIRRKQTCLESDHNIITQVHQWFTIACIDKGRSNGQILRLPYNKAVQTLTFKQPVPPYSTTLNPDFITSHKVST